MVRKAERERNEEKMSKSKKRTQAEVNENDDGQLDCVADTETDAANELTNKERRKARKLERENKKSRESKKQMMSSGDEKETQPEQAENAAPETDDAGEEEEEEAISHKERRKRRKMEKQAAKYGGDRAPARALSKPQRSPFCVWIGNLSFSTSTNDLQAWLEEQGIQGISRVHMTSGARRYEHNKGYV